VALSVGVLSGFVSLTAFAAPPAGVLDETHANVRAVMAVQKDVTADWMRDATVLGTAVGLDAAGNTSLVVYVDQDAKNAGEVIRNLPRNHRGVDVQIELTEKFRAMAKPGGGGGTNSAHPAWDLRRLEQRSSERVLLRRHARLANQHWRIAVHPQQLSRV
jgi:hypothetical protein